jgi:peptidoglycan/LPS O-acetylase OafA/YrhL
MDRAESTRLPTLTGFRFVAALLVFASHSTFEGFFADDSVNRWYASTFGLAGWPGVGFFFVLSGFVLTWSARAGDTKSRFWRRRLVKIYPNHVVGWVVAGALLIGVGAAPTLDVALPNLFLVHAWIPLMNYFASMNGVSWSLCCELLFYLLFPLLHRWIRPLGTRRLWALAGVVVLLVVLVPLVAALLPGDPKVPFNPDLPASHFWFVYLFPPVRVLDFVLGIVAARIMMTGGRAPVGLPVALVLAVAGYALMLAVPLDFGMVAANIVPLTLVIMAGAQADRSGTWSPLRGRFAVWLGEISFAFYVLHQMILEYGHRLIGRTSAWGTVPAIGVVLVFLVVCVFASWVLYRSVEHPIVRRWSSPRRVTTSPSAPPR